MTSTDLANNALDLIGVPWIDNIDSTTNVTAKKCKAAYPKSRQTVISDTNLGITRKEVSLSILTGETSSIWTYVYGRPADCLSIREIWNETTNDDPRIDFEQGTHSNKSSDTILTNQENALLIYSIDITILNRFPVSATNAMELYMAMILATSIKKDEVLAERMQVKYALALANAQTKNQRTQHKKLPEFNKYVNARRGR